jgi:hypothetical protein
MVMEFFYCPLVVFGQKISRTTIRAKYWTNNFCKSWCLENGYLKCSSHDKEGKYVGFRNDQSQ